MYQLECIFRLKGRCRIAEQIGDLPIVNTTPETCNACAGMIRPKTKNKVTAGLAIVAAKQNYPEKLEQVVANASHYISPGSQVATFAKDTAEWMLAGSPVRDDAEVEKLLDICKGCEEGYDPVKERCKVCGCHINGSSAMFNKLRRGTSVCPLGKWGKQE